MLPQHEGFNHQSLDKFNQSLEACGDSSSGDLTALKLGLPFHRGGGNNQQSTSNQMFINRWLKGDNHHLTFHLCSFEQSCSQQFINIGIQQVQIDGPVKVRKFHPQDFLEKKHSKSWKKRPWAVDTGNSDILGHRLHLSRQSHRLSSDAPSDALSIHLCFGCWKAARGCKPKVRSLPSAFQQLLSVAGLIGRRQGVAPSDVCWLRNLRDCIILYGVS